MLVKLSNLKEIAMKLYERHQAGLLSVEEYLHLMTPIDEAIDKVRTLLDSDLGDYSTIEFYEGELDALKQSKYDDIK